MGMLTPQQLYDAIRSAETDMLDTKRYGHNRWRRTTANTTPGGSTAFGPAQLTKTRVGDYLNPKVASRKFAKNQQDLKDFAKKFGIQADLYNIHGNNQAMQGYDPRLGYSNESDPTSGTGMLTSTQDRDNYKKMAKQMMLDTYNEVGGDLDKFIESWRFGRNSTGKVDKKYSADVKRYLKKNP